MNSMEKRIVEELKELKEKYNAQCVKAEFEAEGASFYEVSKLKEFADKTDLDFALKIGGCEAITDMCEAKKIRANSVIAPIIESPYALKKFVNAVQSIFENEIKNINLFVNIETITGYENIDKIVSIREFENVSGIVLGRTDMTNSLNMLKKDVNSDVIFNIAENLSQRMAALKKEMIVGGGVCTNSILFFRNLPYLTKFETRKIIFDAKSALENLSIAQGILKAINFEILWIKNKRESYGIFNKYDNNRLAELNELSKSIENKICCFNNK